MSANNGMNATFANGATRKSTRSKKPVAPYQAPRHSPKRRVKPASPKIASLSKENKLALKNYKAYKARMSAEHRRNRSTSPRQIANRYSKKNLNRRNRTRNIHVGPHMNHIRHMYKLHAKSPAKSPSPVKARGTRKSRKLTKEEEERMALEKKYETAQRRLLQAQQRLERIKARHAKQNAASAALVSNTEMADAQDAVDKRQDEVDELAELLGLTL